MESVSPARKGKLKVLYIIAAFALIAGAVGYGMLRLYRGRAARGPADVVELQIKLTDARSSPLPPGLLAAPAAEPAAYASSGGSSSSASSAAVKSISLDVERMPVAAS